MNLLEDSRMLLLNFKFVMIHIIHKILILIKNHMNFLQDNTFKCMIILQDNTFKMYNKLLFFF